MTRLDWQVLGVTAVLGCTAIALRVLASRLGSVE